MVSVLDHLILNEYSSQSGHGALPYFVGKQYGAGWLRNVARFAFPFVKKALGAVGNIASNTAQDLIENEDQTIGQTLKKHALNEASRVLKRKVDSTINKVAPKAKRLATKRNLIIR